MCVCGTFARPETLSFTSVYSFLFYFLSLFYFFCHQCLLAHCSHHCFTFSDCHWAEQMVHRRYASISLGRSVFCVSSRIHKCRNHRIQLNKFHETLSIVAIQFSTYTFRMAFRLRHPPKHLSYGISSVAPTPFQPRLISLYEPVNIFPDLIPKKFVDFDSELSR